VSAPVRRRTRGGIGGRCRVRRTREEGGSAAATTLVMSSAHSAWEGSWSARAVTERAATAVSQRQPPGSRRVLVDEPFHGLPVLGEPDQLIPRCAVAHAFYIDHHEPVLKGRVAS
jgi:hypothetical protein